MAEVPESPSKSNLIEKVKVLNRKIEKMKNIQGENNELIAKTNVTIIINYLSNLIKSNLQRCKF